MKRGHFLVLWSMMLISALPAVSLAKTKQFEIRGVTSEASCERAGDFISSRLSLLEKAHNLPEGAMSLSAKIMIGGRNRHFCEGKLTVEGYDFHIGTVDGEKHSGSGKIAACNDDIDTAFSSPNVLWAHWDRGSWAWDTSCHMEAQIFVLKGPESR